MLFFHWWTCQLGYLIFLYAYWLSCFIYQFLDSKGCVKISRMLVIMSFSSCGPVVNFYFIFWGILFDVLVYNCYISLASCSVYYVVTFFITNNSFLPYTLLCLLSIEILASFWFVFAWCIFFLSLEELNYVNVTSVNFWIWWLVSNSKITIKSFFCMWKVYYEHMI